ncbi:unnamed protein product [Dracunculus medinensis]|uniref:Uncharacterized protein n=1 Tax=Dracunculus medinensis TaxID=318479 RepID=A0A0N4UNQ9_DRAME|nr:unnamed protein product [Dracunculus medinensis]
MTSTIGKYGIEDRQSPLEEFLPDSRSYRSVETGNLHGSDHVIVRAKIRIKIDNSQHSPRSFNQLKLKNSGTVNINDFYGTTSEYWSKLKECPRKSATSTLGHTSWVSEATVQLSEKAAKARMSGDPDYRVLRK